MRRTLVCGVLLLSAASTARSAPVAPPPPRAAKPTPAPAAVDRRTALLLPPPPARRHVTLRLTLSPEWGYRFFRDREPSSTDKRYTASGVPGASARLELYPLAPLWQVTDFVKGFGITASYSRVFGLTSQNVDTDDDPDTVVDTQWYQYSFGLRFRGLGGTNPLSLGATAGVQRWVFDFDAPSTTRRPVAVGKYTLFSVGADARLTWRAFSVFADGRFLLPVTISRLGDRKPSQPALGVHADLGVAFAFSRVFEVEARAAYTMIAFTLPSVPGRFDKRGTVVDEYVVFGVGATLAF